MTTILVTGATGTVGSILVGLLQTRGFDVRVLARDIDGARGRFGPEIHAVRGDFGDSMSLGAALEGVEAVFLACGNVPEQVAYETALIDEARRAGVGRLVKLSARGAAPDAEVAYWRWHAHLEATLRDSHIPSVILQPSFLMTNLLAAAEPIRQQGMMFAPAGTAPIAMIHPADVAAVATHEEHATVV